MGDTVTVVTTGQRGLTGPQGPAGPAGAGAVWGGITGTLSDQADLQSVLTGKAPIASPTFTGTPAAPTAAPGTNTTQLASTAFVKAAVDAAKGYVSGVAMPIGVAVSDVTSDLTTGTAKVTFRVPCAINLQSVRASVATAPTGANIVVDINENGTSILSTKLSIDAGEKTSTTAATPPVISDTALADDAEITIDIDQVGSTVAGKELVVWLIGVVA